MMGKNRKANNDFSEIQKVMFFALSTVINEWTRDDLVTYREALDVVKCVQDVLAIIVGSTEEE